MLYIYVYVHIYLYIYIYLYAKFEMFKWSNTSSLCTRFNFII